MEDGGKSGLDQLTRQCDNELHTEVTHGPRFVLFFFFPSVVEMNPRLTLMTAF